MGKTVCVVWDSKAEKVEKLLKSFVLSEAVRLFKCICNREIIFL